METAFGQLPLLADRWRTAPYIRRGHDEPEASRTRGQPRAAA